jgi:hypothetical protein
VPDKGLVSFFRVTKCGFYRRKNNASVHVEGALSDAIASVYGWLKGRDFTATIPWDIKDAPGRTQFYSKSMAHNPETGDYLFVFWQRMGDENGDVAGILADSKVGDEEDDSIKIEHDDGGKEYIYGMPLYYWFIPEYDVIASINFPHSTASTEQILIYLKRCIDLRIDHPNKKVSETTVDHPVTGERMVNKRVSYLAGDPEFSMSFALEAKIKEFSLGQVDAETLAKRITHLVVRDKITTEQEDDRDTKFKLWDMVFGGKDKLDAFSKNVELTSEVALDENELKRMLSIYAGEMDDNGWSNLGFKTDGQNGTTKWFGKYIERKHLLMDPVNMNKTYYKAQSVLEELHRDRDQLLEDLKKKIDKPEGDGLDVALEA